MTRERLIVVLVVCMLGACSADDDGGAGKDGANAFPTTDVILGDGSSVDDALIDASADDVEAGDVTVQVDTLTVEDAGSGDTSVDAGSLTDVAPLPDSNGDASKAEDTAGGDDVVPDDEGPGPGPGEDQLCAGSAPGDGKGVPFKGLSYTAPTNQAYNFTCTKCAGGIAGFEGKYRWISEKWDVLPNTPQTFQAADVDTIDFEGNWFTISRRDLNTGKIDTASGYYFCPDEGELGFAKKGYFNTVWYFDAIQGNTMFNTTPGTVNPVHVGGDLDQIETQGAPNWDPNSGGICPGPDCLVYCRVGSVVNGVPCTAPW